ncbi:hypothetical protein M6D81_30280 [Paenibacillus sp. J5C_2022]|nr:hypothetical protein [Paenibacillus sp. J5C2022]
MLLFILALVLSACTKVSESVDFTKWSDEEVYAFFNGVYEDIRQLPVEAESLDVIRGNYETYFSTELTKKIIDSLYTKTDNGWKIPDGDAGYMFSVPGSSQDGKVVIEYSKAFIQVTETFEDGMYNKVQYKIEYRNKPVITAWIIE